MCMQVRFDDGDSEDRVPPQFVREMSGNVRDMSDNVREMSDNVRETRPAHDGGGGNAEDLQQASQEEAAGQAGPGGGPEDVDQPEGQGGGEVESEGYAQDSDDATSASQLSTDSSGPHGA